jgi:hypothetical protein
MKKPTRKIPSVTATFGIGKGIKGRLSEAAQIQLDKKCNITSAELQNQSPAGRRRHGVEMIIP